jgi:putative SOS response-associated peptidase YedK
MAALGRPWIDLSSTNPKIKTAPSSPELRTSHHPLTNAEDHPLMRQFHKPTDEKRMVVILPDDRYDDWLNASPEHSHSLLRQYPAPALQAMPAFAAPAERSQ